MALLLACSTARADESCPDGDNTTLAIEVLERPAILRHDEPIGGDRLLLRARDGRDLMRADSHDFHWMCLAYSKQRGHLVGSRAEMGAVLVLRTIGYLAEDATVLEPSAFTRERFHAYSALASADGLWVAFIGGRDDLALYVLDTTSDTIRKLGPAPKPPPDPTLECKNFDWGVSCVDGYTDVEPEIWRFKGPALLVSYAKDTAARRSKKRTVRRFKL